MNKNQNNKTKIMNNIENYENTIDVEFSHDNPTRINDELSKVSTLLRSSEKTLKAVFPDKKNS